jgi:hypothetical protein
MCEIEFKLEKPTFVVVKVVDVMGKVVSTILKGHRTAGSHKVDFNEKNLNPGKYYYKIFVSEHLPENAAENGSEMNFASLLQSGKVQIENSFDNSIA